jgi:predicted nicotinamide N-methyase
MSQSGKDGDKEVDFAALERAFFGAAKIGGAKIGPALSSSRALIIHPKFPNGFRHFWDNHMKPTREVPIEMCLGNVRQFVTEQTWTSSKGDLGSVVWKGAIALAQFIANRNKQLRGGRRWGETTAVEIGAGAAALPSMVAALEGIDVVCTELPKVLEWARHNVSLNFADEGNPDDTRSDAHAKSLLHFDVLDWGKTAPNNNNSRPYDYVFAADCLYATAAEPNLFKQLVQTLCALLLPGSPTILYMCYVNRQQHFEHTFFGQVTIHC